MLRTLPSGLPGLVTTEAHRSGVSGKLSVPVRPSSQIQAHLRHVVGVSSADGKGVPLLKLHILDSLIDSYLKVQRNPVPREGDGLAIPISVRNVDATIAAVSADLHETLQSFSDEPAGRVAEPGRALNLGA